MLFWEALSYRPQLCWSVKAECGATGQPAAPQGDEAPQSCERASRCAWGCVGPGRACGSPVQSHREERAIWAVTSLSWARQPTTDTADPSAASLLEWTPFTKEGTPGEGQGGVSFHPRPEMAEGTANGPAGTQRSVCTG